MIVACRGLLGPRDRWIYLAMLVAASSGAWGCGRYAGVQRTYLMDLGVRAGRARMTPPPCDVSMMMVSRSDDLQRSEVQHYEGDTLEGDAVLAGPFCVSAKGELGIPEAVQLRSLVRIPRELCVAHSNEAHQERLEDTVPGDPVVHRCLWNRRYVDGHAFDFILTTEPRTPKRPVLQGPPLASSIHGVSVYRNGGLVYRWNGRSPANKSRSTLVVPGNALRGTWMPQFSDIDLRLLPVSVELPPDFFDLQRRSEDVVSLTVERLGEATAALAKDPLREALGPSFEADLASLSAATKSLAGDGPSGRSAGGLDAAWSAFRAAKPEEGARALASLSTAVDDGLSQLHVARETLRTRLDAAAGIWWEGTPEQREKLKARDPKDPTPPADTWTRLHLALDGWSQVQRRIDSAMASVDVLVGIAEKTPARLKELREQIKTLSRDVAAQSEVFQQVAAALAQKSIFEPYTANPPPQVGEQVLRMAYSDQFQIFFANVWNGVPINFTPGLPAAKLTLENAVPFVDLFGFRVQWARSRFAEFRVATGIGYIRDSVYLTAMDKPIAERSMGLAHLNVHLATIQLGVGYVLVFPDDVRFESDLERLRLILGVDLLKLFLGQSATALEVSL